MFIRSISTVHHCRQQVLFQETSPQQNDTFSYLVTGLRPWTQYEFSIQTHNPAGHTRSPWVTITTRQAPPRGLASPIVSHLQGQPSEVLVSWIPPLEPNGVLQSYRIQRNNVSFSFSFDPTVLSYTDEDLLPFATYRYCLLSDMLFCSLKWINLNAYGEFKITLINFHSLMFFSTATPS